MRDTSIITGVDLRTTAIVRAIADAHLGWIILAERGTTPTPQAVGGVPLAPIGLSNLGT